MATVSIPIHAEDAERLRDLARRENRSIQDVLHEIIKSHTIYNNEEIDVEVIQTFGKGNSAS
jgi:predicted DNA-binding protein